MSEQAATMNPIGGQAVIEGVMIRNKFVYTIAIRKPDGSIGVIKRDINSPAQRMKFLRSPFVRGVTALVENLILGIKSLLYSAEVAMPEEENAQKQKKSSDLIVFFGMVPAIILGIALFMVVPSLSTHYIGVVEESRPFLFNLIAGVIRLSVFLIYILVISFMRDIKRTFQYHGAEHKSIFCYEAEKPLVVEEARKFKTLHPRCGTSFLFFVFFITILVFPLITVLIRLLFSNFIELPLVFRKLITIALHLLVALPIISSLSYELLKLTDRMKYSLLVKVIISPGLILQKITTKEPDDGQLEVALEAVKAVI